MTRTALCVWAFLLFVALEPARAFYDPGTQRWLNRDPIQERGGVNLYGFVANMPTVRADLFGLALICVDCNCKGKDLSAFTYAAEEEPHPRGQPEPPKQLREMPPPGQCVEADAVYEPGKATKVVNFADGRISCESGQPKFKYNPAYPDGRLGDGHVWKVGDPPPPPDRRWPSPNIPPYKESPPNKPLPPLEPRPENPPPPGL